MRSLLAVLSILVTASLSYAGVFVELTDGTKLTMESHWVDGNQIHLVRGGVDMIVPKARIKRLDENVADPEVHHDSGASDDEAGQSGTETKTAAGTPAPAAPEFEKPLGDMSVEELEKLHAAESDKLLDLQQKRFGALYGGKADAAEKQAAQEAFTRQNKRNATVSFALEKAKKQTTGGVPTVPPVEQPQ